MMLVEVAIAEEEWEVDNLGVKVEVVHIEVIEKKEIMYLVLKSILSFCVFTC